MFNANINEISSVIEILKGRGVDIPNLKHLLIYKPVYYLCRILLLAMFNKSNLIAPSILMLILIRSIPSAAQDLVARTNDVSINFNNADAGTKVLPLITWKSPAEESSTSPFPSFMFEALVTSEVELKSVSLIFSSDSLTIGEKSYNVVGLNEKKIRQRLSLTDGRNVVKIFAENINGDKVSSKRALLLGEYVQGKNDDVVFTDSGNRIMVKRMELDQDKLNVYYDLIDSVNTHTYSVEVYSFKDNFVMRLEASGDAGSQIKPDLNHKITLNAKEILGTSLDGKFRLELRAKLF